MLYINICCFIITVFSVQLVPQYSSLRTVGLLNAIHSGHKKRAPKLLPITLAVIDRF